MGLLNKDKKSKKNYPTREEFYEKIEKIQNEELKSDRYSSIYAFLIHNYWNRNNKDFEEKLFNIIGTYGLEKSMINESSEYKKIIRFKRYEDLKQFIDSLSEEQIDSNIFLKSTYLLMNMSNDVCLSIMNELYNKINSDNLVSPIKLQIPIPNEIKKIMPDYVDEEVGIKYYKPEVYKTEYIKVLDSEHEYVYKDYNSIVNKIGELAEDIFFLKLNKLLLNTSKLECYHFQVYHPGDDNHFNVSFFVNQKQNNQIENNSILSEEYVLKKKRPEIN